jgi:3alpha(or 20beta)-hydroxysteroid dehydrogenase
MTGSLSGATIVVTGAARGLGASIAETCIRHGASVVLTDVLVDHVRATAERLGPQASAHPLDVTDPAAWSALADLLRARGGRPHGLVNNAGIVTPKPITETSVDDLRRALEVNVTGTFLGIKTFVELHHEMAAPRPGSIVNIASVRGLVGGKNASTYSASKFAVRGLTKALATELGSSGIRVNAVCPGPIATDMSVGNPDFAEMDWDAYCARLPLGHIGQPVDIGEAVAWLLSDSSGFVSGIDLPVDGGLTATTYSVEPKLA